MKSLVIYDSNFGNTKIIAETISKELGKDSKALFISDFDVKDLTGISLLIVGSPIIGWRPSEKMGTFLEVLGKNQLKGIKVATFDTRVKVFFHGDAAKKILKKPLIGWLRIPNLFLKPIKPFMFMLDYI